MRGLRSRAVALLGCYLGVLLWAPLATAAVTVLPTQAHTADPAAHVFADGRLWLYTSHDQPCQADFHMKDWLVFSTDDLKHWTAHGSPLTVSQFAWADNYAWAPDATYRHGKYYLVVPVGTGVKNRQDPRLSTKWMGIGVAVSDHPAGPFRDAIGAPLWRTPYANDPALFIDDDDTPWLYFHGQGADYQVVKLSDDLLRTEGDFIQMDMGGVTPKMEGPWVFKRNGLYYFTMPQDNRDLAYYTATSPTGPWHYRGIFMPRQLDQNNHHSIVQYKGQWWLFYHQWVQKAGCDRLQRQVVMQPLQFDSQGLIIPMSFR